jgi:hypothetical protein
MSERVRFKKLLKDDEILSIVAASDRAIAESQDRLAPIVGDIVEPGWLDRGVTSGHYKVREVALNGVPMYRYFFHINDQGWLNINAACFIGPGKPYPALWGVGAEAIAREFGAKGIVFITRRRGAIVQARGVGYKVLGVMLEKKL